MDGIAESQTPLLTIKTKEAATAISISSKDAEHDRLLAIGLENGDIYVYVNEDAELRTWKEKCALDRRFGILKMTAGSTTDCPYSIAHTDQIHRLSWRPCLPRNPGTHQLASCSEDGTLRVITIQTSL